MPQFDKHFTLAEARAALPGLRRRLRRIQDLLAELQTTQTMTILRGNGKGPVLTGAGDRKDEAQRLIESIAAEGIQLKDVRRGLVDFPHFLDGDPTHEVFLCWHLGEDTVEYWHGIEAGFAGREPL